MTQSQALSVMKAGANVFLTGEPGSGKTYTIQEYVAYTRAQGIETAVTASTGIAATHIGGMTIHSWSGIGVKGQLSKHDIDTISRNKRVAKRIQKAEVLIIDEISMLSGSTLSLVESVCRSIKKRSAPFGGLQVIFVGDFFQLPPIMKKEAADDAQQLLIQDPIHTRFAYDSRAWKDASPSICYLTEQHRQDDVDFLNLLSAIRQDAFTKEHLRTLQQRKIEYDNAPENVPKLFSHNADVDRVNESILEKLSGAVRACSMSAHGPEPMVSALQKWCLSPAELHLKIGAAVMFTKNNQKEGFVNGTLGVVEKFDPRSGYPSVRTRGGRLIDVEPMDWVIEENGEIRARITQIPLRLAWALTVHKSQGMSLDAAVVDLTGVFEFGQGYVALSRVRRLAGLYLLGWNERAFRVHPEVLAQDTWFRSQSESTKPEVTQSQHSKKNDLVVRRGYRAWDQEQDAELQELYLGGATIQDLAKEFSRTQGSIRSRLAKLSLLDVESF